MSSPREVNREVRLIGWAYVALGLVMAFLAAFLLGWLWWMRAYRGVDLSEFAAPADVAGTSADLTAGFRWIVPVCWMSMAFGLGILAAALALLKGRSWARRVIVAITWIGIVHNLWLGVILWRWAEAIARDPLLEGIFASPPAIRAGGILAWFAVAVLFNLPLLTITRILRRANRTEEVGS